jgi:branched-chain amino acid transport system permease protein
MAAASTSLSPVALPVETTARAAAWRTQTWLWLGALVVACAMPLVFSDYYLFQATMILIYAIVLFGLVFLTGYSGQISLGHGAFYALGAYTTAILVTRFGVPYWLTLPVSAALCLVVGFVFGRPALKLQGHYLALATFALAVATPQLLKHKKLQAWTGGVQGIILDKPSAPFGLPMGQDTWLYCFTLVVAVVLIWLGRNLVKGQIGRALLSIKDHPTAAAALGVDTALYKSMAFAISALYCGVAGSLGGIAVQFVAPDSFYPLLSIIFMVGAVIGGLNSLWGPLFGAMFIQFVPNLADDMSKSASWAIYGFFMVACVFLMPNGIAGAFHQLRNAVRRFRTPR